MHPTPPPRGAYIARQIARAAAITAASLGSLAYLTAWPADALTPLISAAWWALVLLVGVDASKDREAHRRPTIPDPATLGPWRPPATPDAWQHPAPMPPAPTPPWPQPPTH